MNKLFKKLLIALPILFALAIAGSMLAPKQVYATSNTFCADGSTMTKLEVYNARVAGKISGSIQFQGGTAVLTVSNQTGCSAPVEAASYKAFSESTSNFLSTQVFFASSGVTNIAPMGDTVVTVAMPTCRGQADLWYGSAPHQLSDYIPQGLEFTNPNTPWVFGGFMSLTGVTTSLPICQNQTPPSNLTVSCYATPNPVNANQSVSFISNVSGGTGSYTYSWTGACTGSSQSCSSTFSQTGTQTATINVTSGSQTNSATCSVNVNQNCTQNSYQRCNGNYLYWYDSCGNQQGQGQFCQNGCYNNSCQNNNNNNYNYNYNNNCTSSFSVQTNSPTNIYNNSATLNGYLSANGYNGNCNNNYNGTCQTNVWFQWGTTSSYGYETPHSFQSNSGAFMQNISGLFPGNTYHYRAVAQDCSGNIMYGQDMTFYAAPQVLGASYVSTGLTNNFWVDSFFLPLLLTLILLWIWKSGMFVGLEKWLDNKRKSSRGYKSEKELASRIANIQKTERA